uniref:Capsid protein n=1 Tax=Arvicanthis rat circovirus TaxID=3141855 RepID=A0AAU7E2X7_9CIRC
MTTDWPVAPKVPTGAVTGDPQVETPLQWNFDHLTFRLSDFVTPGQGVSKFQHTPPFRYYRIRKVVVQAKWINWTYQNMENVLGNTALDLDGEDTGRGNVTRSKLDPNVTDYMGQEPDPNKAPFRYDPLWNRSSKKHWRASRGFTRIFRPKPQMTEPFDSTKMTHWLIRGQPWVSVREGADLPWNGLSISLRQMKDPLNEDDRSLPQLQYTMAIYVAFKEFDYEIGKTA